MKATNDKSGSVHWSKPAVGATSPAGPLLVLDGELTHYGQSGVFREEPRWSLPEKAVSMCRGRMPVDEVWQRMTRRKESAPEGSEVRIFEVVTLTSADYAVRATPTSKNDQHVSVGAPIELKSSPPEHQAWWDDPTRVRLAALVKQEAQDVKV